MNKTCPSLRTEIIPSLPAPLAHGRHLSHSRADVTPKTPAKEASLLCTAFPRTGGFRPLALGCKQVDL